MRVENRIDYLEGRLGARGGHRSRRIRGGGEGEIDLKGIQGDIARIEGHLMGAMETWCSGNFLKDIKVISMNVSK